MFCIRLVHQLLEEAVWVTEASAVDDVKVCDEPITPIEPKHVLTSTCRQTAQSLKGLPVADGHVQAKVSAALSRPDPMCGVVFCMWRFDVAVIPGILPGCSYPHLGTLVGFLD